MRAPYQSAPEHDPVDAALWLSRVWNSCLSIAADIAAGAFVLAMLAAFFFLLYYLLP